MKNITIIAAIGKNRELGKDNKLIWPIKEDLKFFKAQTMGKPVAMGMRTLESLPKLLPGRQHVVLTTKERELAQIKDTVVNYSARIYELYINVQGNIMRIVNAS